MILLVHAGPWGVGHFSLVKSLEDRRPLSRAKPRIKTPGFLTQYGRIFPTQREDKESHLVWESLKNRDFSMPGGFSCLWERGPTFTAVSIPELHFFRVFFGVIAGLQGHSGAI